MQRRVTNSRTTRRSRIASALGVAATAVVFASQSVAHEGHDHEAPVLHPMVIRQPPTLGQLTTELVDINGSPIGIRCETCHSPGDSEALAQRPGAPEGMHDGIWLVHGDLRCDSCHDPQDRTRLRLADGESIPMESVLRLCGQCHGPQLRAFEHAAHGGARGYWDRSRGPMIRNSCIACHAAHRPVYPIVRPVAPPNDRFVTPRNTHPSSEREEEETP
jgi:hypothetical protein